MNKQELNKKLAEWAGFKFEPHLSSRGNTYKTTHLIVEPDGCSYIAFKGEHPNFTQSLDACFKWLVPKLGTYSLEFHVNEWGTEIILLDMTDGKWSFTDTSPALALCLAIEKLIDGGR